MENLTVSLVFGIVGSGLLIIGFYLRNSYLKIQLYGIRIKAQINDYVKENDFEGDSIYYPIVTFIDNDGVKIEQKLNFGTNQKWTNEQIDIIYLKKGDNYKIIIDNIFWKTYLPLIFIIIGIICLGAGLVLLMGNK